MNLQKKKKNKKQQTRKYVCNNKIKMQKILLINNPVDKKKIDFFDLSEVLLKAKKEEKDLIQLNQTKEFAICFLGNFETF